MEGVTKLVRLSFNEPAYAQKVMNDTLDSNRDTSRLEAFMEPEFQSKIAAEVPCPPETGCDQLEPVIHRLSPWQSKPKGRE
ncbi:hypothetical protein R38712_01715 [Ralstonia pickettii]|jgi:hypothetical protein|uniref:Uncharacterized protein n=2 Tax=Ralstonia pickettii TaxID=329 RepID=A0ABM9IL12_RALPI|nr:hypothetical protein R38712_01715 [Ralstonia pickettii]